MDIAIKSFSDPLIAIEEATRVIKERETEMLNTLGKISQFVI